MQNQLGLVFKLFLLSSVLSLLIKYGGESLAIPANTGNVVVIILLPTLIIATLLLWRIPRHKENR